MKDKSYIAHKRENSNITHTVEHHLQGVADKTRTFAEKIGLGLAGELIGLLHDLGKYSKEFQDYIQSATGMIDEDEDDYVDAKYKKGKIDHSSAGAQYIWQALGSKDPISRMVGQILALCVASHHSGLIDCLSIDGKDKFNERMEKVEKKTHLEEVKNVADRKILERADNLLKNSELRGIAGAIIFFISQKNKLKNIDILSEECLIQFQIGLMVRILFSCLIDADRIDTANFQNPQSIRKRNNNEYVNWDLLISRLESKLKNFNLDSKINQLRHAISQQCFGKSVDRKGFFTLTVPTGGGKTLAGLRFALHHARAHRLDRVIFVVPFTSIIEQNAKVTREYLEQSDDELGSIVLEHHSNLTPEQETSRTKILSENWDAPVVYTTSVQLLETLFGSGTRGARRMHQLTNSLIIFDEIQTLPIRTIHMFCNAMNYLVDHCGSSVMLCTATQPLLTDLHDKTKGYLNISSEREIIPDVNKLFADLKRIEIIDKTKVEGWSDEGISQLAVKEMEDSGSCLVIVNTKASAQSLYQYCKKLTHHIIYHLSTSMCPAHRTDKLKEIKERLHSGKSLICISTQLIEAGVDIDFGSVIRFIAGMDSIAQAAGRCNRNGERLNGKVYIVNPSLENIDMLTEIKIGKEKTERILRELKDPHSSIFNYELLHPDVIKLYFKYYFFDCKDKMDYPVNSKEIGRDDTLLEMLATNRLNPKMFEILPKLRQSFMSAANAFKAIDNHSQGVIVPYGDAGKQLIIDLCNAYEVQKQIKLIKKAQRYSVNVFHYEWDRLRKAGALFEIQPGTEIYYLDECYYSENFGLSIEPVNAFQALVV